METFNFKYGEEPALVIVGLEESRSWHTEKVAFQGKLSTQHDFAEVLCCGLDWWLILRYPCNQIHHWLLLCIDRSN